MKSHTQFSYTNNFYLKCSWQTTMMNGQSHVVEAAKRFEPRPRSDRRRKLGDNYLLKGVRSNVKYTIIDTFDIKTYLKVILLIVRKVRSSPFYGHVMAPLSHTADWIAFRATRFESVSNQIQKKIVTLSWSKQLSSK